MALKLVSPKFTNSLPFISCPTVEKKCLGVNQNPCISKLNSFRLPASAQSKPPALCSATRKSFVVMAAQGTTVDADEKESVGTVTEVDINTYHLALEAAKDKLVVLDMFTQWCGPCKLIFPKIQKLALEMEDVVFLKLDCNQMNKPLAKELGIRVVPTFKLFKNKKVVGEVTGAKYDVLEAEIRKLRS